MTADDDLLARVHQEAARRIRRRHRLAVGAAAAIVILGASAAAAGVATHDDSSKVVTTSPETTTTDPPPTTTEPPAATSTAPATTTAPPATTTTATPTTTTTTTAPPTTTTTAPPAPTVVIRVGRSGDLTATATATVDPARPGFVTITVRISDPYGSQPWGAVEWAQGDVGEAFGDSAWVQYYPTSCDELIDDDPTTNLEPDRAAGPVDRTFTVTHDYGPSSGTAAITVSAVTSFCTTDSVQVRIDLPVPLGG